MLATQLSSTTKEFPPKQALRTFNIQNNTQKSEKTPKKRQIFLRKASSQKSCARVGVCGGGVGGKATPEEPPRRHGLLVELTQQTTAITWGNTSSRTRPDLKHPRKTARTSSENSRKTQKKDKHYSRLSDRGRPCEPASDVTCEFRCSIQHSKDRKKSFQMKFGSEALREIITMLTILGLSFLWLVTSAVDPAFSHPSQDQSTIDSVGYKILENRLDQLELQLNNTNTLLAKIVTSLDVIQQQTRSPTGRPPRRKRGAPGGRFVLGAALSCARRLADFPPDWPKNVARILANMQQTGRAREGRYKRLTDDAVIQGLRPGFFGMTPQYLRQRRKSTSKVYQLRLPLRASPIDVFCDMELLDGGWLVIQHRFDGSVDFNRSWAEYRDGFGVVGPSSEFWLGLEAVFQLTRGGDYELLVQLRNESGHDGQIRYERFLVSGEDREYSLSFVGGFPGTMGEVMHGNLGEGFSTYDSDNDKWSEGNCAQKYGGGWWFYDCKHTTLNGPFEKDNNTGRGMYWKGWTIAATYSRMLIRRR
ncbi:fibrinogen and fibronectin [Culex quinquefasciatus]|uniref:Fibrinogen and fibronectin n=1 Tax=Culex quinquefasciatus TaxID=7176 RepID=B0WHF7_CULQU|nr:fibrinogen and fibronectin [Culex quinquefasciatus]|eukprot:XP_001848141.1 fibrinogen and fibronectin [Culex quinquefasciatus]